tara:strand:+ start:24 stop:338 length:315 start_codon:yes stop_codon:yes gene_type:complete
MKKLVLLIILVLTIGCQREKMNVIGVSYNKSLIIPPSNDLPEPSKTKETSTSNLKSDNPIVKSILDQTDSNEVSESIIEKIDNDSGYKSDENFFQWLFKGKSKR